MNLVEDNSEVSMLLSKFTYARAGSIWIVKNKKFKNSLYVKCKEGWVEITGGYFETKRPQPSYKFIDQFIQKEINWEDYSHSGHYFFE